jgi:DNA-binding transcriptional ArsR family regulator
MRPLFHPAIEDVTVEAILHALGDPARVSIYASIAASTCALTCTNLSSVTDKTIPKSTLSQHFKILREGGLIRSERRGVEMLNTSRCAEIEQRFPGLLPAIVDAHNRQNAGRSASGSKAKRAVARAKSR